MRHICLISIYIGNLNYKIKIPFFFRCRGEIFTCILYRIRHFFTKYNAAMSFFMLNASYTCC